MLLHQLVTSFLLKAKKLSFKYVQFEISIKYPRYVPSMQLEKLVWKFREAKIDINLRGINI